MECYLIKREHISVFQLWRDESAFKGNKSAPVFYYQPDEFCFFSGQEDRENVERVPW